MSEDAFNICTTALLVTIFWIMFFGFTSHIDDTEINAYDLGYSQCKASMPNKFHKE